jgi:hypothetical protein
MAEIQFSSPGNSRDSLGAHEPDMANVTAQLRSLQEELADLQEPVDPDIRADLQLRIAQLRMDLGDRKEAWAPARECFDHMVRVEKWEQAVTACEIMYLSEQDKSIAALAQGVWLGVTFPIDPELSVAMLQHLIEEMPERADGRAVAAATAHYVADMRSTGAARDSLMFFTAQLMSIVAQKHREIETQDHFNIWLQGLELDNPSVFLPRLSKVLDAVVGGDWWYDRDELRAKIPND